MKLLKTNCDCICNCVVWRKPTHLQIPGGKVSQPLSGGKRPKKPSGSSNELSKKKQHFIEAVEPTDEDYEATVVTIEG